MSLLFILSAPLIAMVVARWAWRFHLRALRALGPGIAAMAGAPAPVSTAEVVSVLVEGDTVLVGLRPAEAGSDDTSRLNLRAPVSTLVLSLAGEGYGPVARLERWHASGAPVLVWQDDGPDTVEFWQLQTGQGVRLPMVSRTTDHSVAHAAGHPSRREKATD
jgi:hypothetical protein